VVLDQAFDPPHAQGHILQIAIIVQVLPPKVAATLVLPKRSDGMLESGLIEGRLCHATQK
jgi:hypothetical protein